MIKEKKNPNSNLKFGYFYFSHNFREACINKAKDSIRFINKLSTNGRSTSISYGYFKLDDNGIITKCERRYTKDYKGATVGELDKFPPMMMFGREM